MHLLDFTQSFKSFYYPSLIAIIYFVGGGERLIFKRVEEIKSGFYVNEFVYSDNVIGCGVESNQSDCNSELHCRQGAYILGYIQKYAKGPLRGHKWGIYNDT